jgi:hypothetical protein
LAWPHCFQPGVDRKPEVVDQRFEQLAMLAGEAHQRLDAAAAAAGGEHRSELDGLRASADHQKWPKRRHANPFGSGIRKNSDAPERAEFL